MMSMNIAKFFVFYENNTKHFYVILILFIKCKINNKSYKTVKKMQRCGLKSQIQKQIGHAALDVTIVEIKSVQINPNKQIGYLLI